MTAVDPCWFTAYATYELECDSPILEALGVYWSYVKKPMEQYMRTLMEVNIGTPEYDDAMRLAMLSKGGMLLRFVTNPTPEMCRVAVQNRPYAIRHVHDPSPELCCLAAQGSALSEIPTQRRTYEVCALAVQHDGIALEYVPHTVSKSHPELYMLAVTKTGMALPHVPEKHRTPELLRAAVLQDPRAMRYVHYATQELYVAAALGNLTRAGRIHGASKLPADWDGLLSQITAIVQQLH